MSLGAVTFVMGGQREVGAELEELGRLAHRSYFCGSSTSRG